MKRKYLRILVIISMLLTLLPGQVKAADIVKYVALGDSISTGYGLNATQSNFVSLVAEEARYSSSQVLNAAGNGYTISDVIASLSNANVQAAIGTAEVVTITAGGNDLLGVFYSLVLTEVQKYNPSATLNDVQVGLASGDATYLLAATTVLNSGISTNASVTSAITNYGTALASLIDTIKTLNPNAKIVVVNQYNPYPGFNVDGNALQVVYTEFEKAIVALNTVTTNVCTSKGVIMADAYSLFKQGGAALVNSNPATMNLDIHPNEAGHATIAQAVDNAWVRTSEIVLDFNNGTNDKISVFATEGSTNIDNPTNIYPGITNGYIFMGYYTSTDLGSAKVMDYDLNLIADVPGYTDANGAWIGGNTTLYAIWQKYIQICDNTSCENIIGTSTDLYNNGEVLYDAVTNTLKIKDLTREIEVTVFMDNVKIILENTTSTVNKNVWYINGQGTNLTVEINGNFEINMLDYAADTMDGNFVIDGNGVLDVSFIYAYENDKLLIGENVVVNAEGMTSYGSLEISGTVNVTNSSGGTAIDSDKILITNTGNVTVDDAYIGMFAYGDYDAYLDNSNSIVIENGGTYKSTNTHIAMVVWTEYPNGNPLTGDKVIVLPDGYLKDNEIVSMNEYNGDYIYTLATKGSSLEITIDSNSLVIDGALGNVELLNHIDNPATFDGITSWIMMLCGSMIAIIMGVILLKKQTVNN